MALRYKALSVEAKADLEKSLCVRNVMRWIELASNTTTKADSGRNMDDVFTETLGLNVDMLLMDNEYLAHFPVSEIKKKFSDRAEKINMAPQDYVNMCAG